MRHGRRYRRRPEGERRTMPVLVLPLHGHLAPAAWAAAQATPGLRGRLRADRRRGAAGLALAATSPSCASAACSAATSPPRPAYGGEHEALSTVGALDAAAHGLGWDAVLVGPGPGIIGSDTEFGHGGMAALDSAHAALALGLPTLLSPRLSSRDPRERHRDVSHHTFTVLELLLGAVEVASRPARSRSRGQLLAEAAGERHRLRGGAADLAGYGPPACRPRRWAARIDEDPLFFAAAARRRADLARLSRASGL